MLSAIRAEGARPTINARQLFIVSASMYDAWASFEPDASGYAYDDVHVPNAELQEAAVSYAAFASLSVLFPDYEMETGAFSTHLRALRLRVDEGWVIGRDAAQAVFDARDADGSNHFDGYRDTTSERFDTPYAPVNSADPDASNAVGGPDFDPNRWTPIRVPTGVAVDARGFPVVDPSDPASFVDQEFLTPHWGAVTPFALDPVDATRPPTPPRFGDLTPYTTASGEVTTGDAAYRAQFADVLAISATLTDRQKVLAEFWADGPRSEAPPGHWNQLAHGVSTRDEHGVGEDVRMYFALNAALLDASIAAWECKRHFDFIRPVTAIHFLFGDESVEAWGGPDLGTQTIMGKDWRPYQDTTFVTPPFAEYVSGHSVFSRAAAEVLTRFTGSEVFFDGVSRSAEDIDGDGERDLLGQHIQRAGSNLFESSPASDVVLEWPTFHDAAAEAGISRLYGGIHIRDGDLYGRQLGVQVGATAYSRASAMWGER